ncbi:D-arabinono-1,4-lactone oxidase [Cellulomonas sp. PhB143]|uniref:D-arabinono-1,4-lactone oxidase n=1 Tax=Cellulomonas sp. PhB143 TaxID=2485186 RepID=UPI000F488F95|nr:D-arabinono-1,4-lactone oxidase [Cellulomonas sp. PhB143]ROS78793.1 FAD-linked oxidoreductase [Cellulomonas sp. PhB143]
MSTSTGSPVWTNWARTESARPARRAAPRDEAELSAQVAAAAAAGLHVRAVGAGHSFTGAAVTDGLMLSLDAMARVHDVRPGPGGTTHVTVDAGMRLSRLNEALGTLGLAMPNLGDVVYQSVAGAISTGTHGTGARLRGLAAQVRGVRVVGPDGTVSAASATQDADLFEASRLGLGQTGVLSTVTLEVVPAFLLRAHEAPLPLEEVLTDLDGPGDLVAGNDHFELYWFPGTTTALTKRNNRLGPDEPHVDPSGTALARARSWFEEDFLENTVLGAIDRLAAAVPRATPSLNRFISGALSERTYVAPSHRVFASPRRVRFREMEYAVPRAELVGVLREVDAWLRRSGEPVPFPIEVRFAASDDVWLSTAYGRETAYVAVHQYERLPHERWFAAVEEIVTAVGGRPHWGKLNGLDAARAADLYPRFEDFRRVRSARDPGGVFANPYTDRVFGSR